MICSLAYDRLRPVIQLTGRSYCLWQYAAAFLLALFNKRGYKALKR